MAEDREPGWQGAIGSALARRFGIDERALAAYRIAIAGLLLVDLLAFRAPDLGAFYTDAGVLPRALLRETFPVAARLSLHTLTGSLSGQAALLAGLALAAALLLVGYRTRLAAVATWVLVASMQARNPWVVNAGDTLLLATLFFGLFLPLGRRWSIDAARRDPASREREDPRVVNAATVGVLLQIVVVYATNVAFKLRAPRWTDGTAVAHVFALDDFTVFLGDALADVGPVLVAANWAWLAALAASPLLVLLTGWPRAGYAALLAGLHLGMLATLVLGVFPLVAVAALLLVLPPEVWEPLEARVAPLAERLAARVPTADPSDRPRMPQGWRRRARRTGNLALGALIVAGLVWHGMAVGLVGRPDAVEEAGRAAEHRWSMFSPASTTYGWVAAPANLTDGGQVDALRLIPYDPAPPGDLSEAYPSTLWHRYLKDAPELGEAELAALADHLCHRVDEAYASSPRDVAVVTVEHEVRLDGPDPVERERVHRQACPTA